MKKPALPYGIPFPPRVQRTHSALIDVDSTHEHTVMVDTWWNGEGITITADNGKQPEQRILLTWEEWYATKLVVKAIRDAERKEHADAARRNSHD